LDKNKIIKNKFIKEIEDYQLHKDNDLISKKILNICNRQNAIKSNEMSYDGKSPGRKSRSEYIKYLENQKLKKDNEKIGERIFRKYYL
jgi:hypothetical protein